MYDIEKFKKRPTYANGVEISDEELKKKYGMTPNYQTLNEAAYQCAYDLSEDWAIDNPTWEDVEAAYKMGAEDGMEYIRRKINGK